MRLLLRLFLIADWFVALAWLGRGAEWLYGLRLVPDLRDDAYQPGESQPEALLSVVVPARDEAKAIGSCLRSLLASSGVSLELIAVDDRSDDDTGRIMDKIAAEADGSRHSLKVIHVKTLPDGWMGKTHAMAEAVAHATGEWVLFTDGDMLFAPEALARAMKYARVAQADHVILYPTMLYEGFGERMMLSFLHVMSIWGVRPWKVGDPKAKRDFIGIGAFNLMRRSVYDEVGGWESLRMEVLEDLRMGFVIKRKEYRQRAVFGRDLTRIRWAEGALGAVDNMTKNLFALFRFRLRLAVLAVSSVTALCLLPLAGLMVGRSGLWPLLLMLTVLAVLYGRYERLGLPGVFYVLTFPVGSSLFIFAMVRSIATTVRRGGVTWRGTFYPLKALKRVAGAGW